MLERKNKEGAGLKKNSHLLEGVDGGFEVGGVDGLVGDVIVVNKFGLGNGDVDDVVVDFLFFSLFFFFFFVDVDVKVL